MCEEPSRTEMLLRTGTAINVCPKHRDTIAVWVIHPNRP